MPVLTFIIAQTDSQQRNSKILEDMPKMHLKENGGMEQEGPVKIQEEASPFKPERSEIAQADFVWDSRDEVGGGGLLREEEDLKASICE